LELLSTHSVVLGHAFGCFGNLALFRYLTCELAGGVSSAVRDGQRTGTTGAKPIPFLGDSEEGQLTSSAHVRPGAQKTARGTEAKSVYVPSLDVKELHGPSAALEDVRRLEDRRRPEGVRRPKNGLSLGHLASANISPSVPPRRLDTERKLAAVQGRRADKKVVLTRPTAKQAVVAAEPDPFFSAPTRQTAKDTSQTAKDDGRADPFFSEQTAKHSGRSHVKRRPVVVLPKKPGQRPDQTKRPLGFVVRKPQAPETDQQAFGPFSEAAAAEETMPYFFATEEDSVPDS
jgi:hypothetical protein